MLWYDPTRWPSWVDGFGHIVKLDGEWPDGGRPRLWQSPPGGRGMVEERVVAYEIRAGQTLEVEDETFRGRQVVTFTPRPEDVEVTLTLEYEIKDRNPLTPAVDLCSCAGAMTRRPAAHAQPLLQRAQGRDRVRWLGSRPCSCSKPRSSARG